MTEISGNRSDPSSTSWDTAASSIQSHLFLKNPFGNISVQRNLTHQSWEYAFFKQKVYHVRLLFVKADPIIVFVAAAVHTKTGSTDQLGQSSASHKQTKLFWLLKWEPVSHMLTWSHHVLSLCVMVSLKQKLYFCMCSSTWTLSSLPG